MLEETPTTEEPKQEQPVETPTEEPKQEQPVETLNRRT